MTMELPQLYYIYFFIYVPYNFFSISYNVFLFKRNRLYCFYQWLFIFLFLASVLCLLYSTLPYMYTQQTKRIHQVSLCCYSTAKLSSSVLLCQSVLSVYEESKHYILITNRSYNMCTINYVQ